MNVDGNGAGSPLSDKGPLYLRCFHHQIHPGRMQPVYLLQRMPDVLPGTAPIQQFMDNFHRADPGQDPPPGMFTRKGGQQVIDRAFQAIFHFPSSALFKKKGSFPFPVFPVRGFDIFSLAQQNRTFSQGCEKGKGFRSFCGPGALQNQVLFRGIRFVSHGGYGFRREKFFCQLHNFIAVGYLRGIYPDHDFSGPPAACR